MDKMGVQARVGRGPSDNKRVAPTPRKRGSGEHRRKTLRSLEAVLISSTDVAGLDARPRRRRNSRNVRRQRLNVPGDFLRE